jgi:hypothetical protein
MRYEQYIKPTLKLGMGGADALSVANEPDMLLQLLLACSGATDRSQLTLKASWLLVLSRLLYIAVA